MITKTIAVPNSDLGISEYLAEYPLPEEILLMRLDEQKRTAFTFSAEDAETLERTFKVLVTEVICSFYKTRALMTEIDNLDIGRQEIAAYLGTLSAFDRETEKKSIIHSLFGLDYVNLDGLLTFRLAALSASWKEMGRLATKLIGACVTDEDVRELTAFMLGMSKVDGILRLRAAETPKIEKAGRLYPVAALTGNTEFDLIFSMLKEAPKSIVVPHPEQFSESVLQTIKSLGDG